MPNKAGRSYVVRYEPRGRLVKYIVLKEVDNKEYQEERVDDQIVVSIQEVLEDLVLLLMQFRVVFCSFLL